MDYTFPGRTGNIGQKRFVASSKLGAMSQQWQLLLFVCPINTWANFHFPRREWFRSKKEATITVPGYGYYLLGLKQWPQFPSLRTSIRWIIVGDAKCDLMSVTLSRLLPFSRPETSNSSTFQHPWTSNSLVTTTSGTMSGSLRFYAINYIDVVWLVILTSCFDNFSCSSLCNESWKTWLLLYKGEYIHFP